MLSLLAAILVFGLIILFHEFGHFLFAKLGGICVVEFSLGMGPRLFSFNKGGTKYSLKLLPFGGSCMMLGEDDLGEEESADKDVDKDKDKDTDVDKSKHDRMELPPGATGVSFNDTSVWTRFSVIVAGPAFNFILAFVCALFVIGYAGYDPPEVYQVTAGYPAEEAGMQAGDVITDINGEHIKIYRDILSYTTFHKGETLNIKYERDGKSYEAALSPEFSEETGRYLMGISGGVYRKTESVLTWVKYSTIELEYWIKMTFKSLGMIVKRQVSKDDIAGPVRIVSMIDDTVKQSSEYGIMVVLVNLANMCMLLSANLGIMNLLPIPALDGGRLVFILLEAIRGKPIDREKEGMVHMAGMAFLMVLMVFVLFNDIQNMF
ncbi:MAG: RIP metalloprotease RseP [Clostridium sp.]